jgi:hypothetical protein
MDSFVGSGTFCIKLCDPTVTSPDYCEKFVTSVHRVTIHSLTYVEYSRYDLIGCTYNMPASYKDGEFTSCEGDLQDVVGTYTSGGQSESFELLSHLLASV